MSTPDYSDKTKYNVQGGNEGDPIFIDPTIPSKLHTNSVVNRYLLFLHPEWNSILNPAFNPQRSSIETYDAGKGEAVRDKAIKWNLDLRKRGLVYYSRTGKIIPIIEAEAHALSIKLAQEQIAITKGRVKKGDSVFSSFEPTVALNETITSIIPSIPEAQASGITVPESATIGFDNITENSVLVFWNPHGDGGSPITSYHVMIKNQDTGQTILQQTIGDPRQPSPIQTNLFVQNLDSGTNYKAYVIVINAIGNSFEQSYGFKTLGSALVITPKVTLSQETISIINKFDTGVYQIVGNYPLDILIESVKNGKMTNQNFIQTVKSNLEYGQFIDTSISEIISPIIDTSINSMMVSQSIGAFILKDGRVKGEILYIANQSFNPFYYGKNLASLVQIKSKSGVPIAIKPNVLNFTNTERDERIQIDEAVGNFKELIIDFFVWESLESAVIFSENKQIQVVEESPDPECQVGYHKDFSGKCVPDDPLPEIPRDKLIDTLKGFLFGTVALSLLARKY